MTKNDVTTDSASEMFVVVLSTSSKAGTVILANAKNYLTNHSVITCSVGTGESFVGVSLVVGITCTCISG